MNALGAQVPGHGFGQNTLRRLGRCKSGIIWLAAKGRRITGDDNSAATTVNHVGGNSAGQVQQTHGINPKGLFHILRVNFLKGAKDPARRVVHHHVWHAHFRHTGGHGFIDGSFVGDIARNSQAAV